jgi:rRNA maturation RNase YbeY
MIDSDRKSPVPQAGMQRAVNFLDATGAMDVQLLARLEDAAVEALGILQGQGEVRVRIVSDSEMAAAHQRYKGQPGPTDVLTFDLSGGSELDVDILINRDEAGRQAASRGHPTEQELLLYTIHGILHCLGYDDHDEESAARMHEVEDRVLGELGVGVTYARPERAEGGKDGH